MLNKIVALLMLVAVTASAQGYKSRRPTPTELDKVAGVDYYLKDGPQYQIYFNTVGEGENITLQPTNSILVVRSLNQLTNCVVVFPNPTNNPGRVYQIYTLGNVTVTLTNNPVGTFTTSTNVTASTYGVPTNSTAIVISTKTNWFVMPGAK